jgi:hypothetical protein
MADTPMADIFDGTDTENDANYSTSSAEEEDETSFDKTTASDSEFSTVHYSEISALIADGRDDLLDVEFQHANAGSAELRDSDQSYEDDK